MPLYDEHCKRSQDKYGYDFAEIHNWMDEPGPLFGMGPKKERHDLNNTPREAELLFSSKIDPSYKSFIRDVVIDHIHEDQYELSDIEEFVSKGIAERSKEELDKKVKVDIKTQDHKKIQRYRRRARKGKVKLKKELRKCQFDLLK